MSKVGLVGGQVPHDLHLVSPALVGILFDLLGLSGDLLVLLVCLLDAASNLVAPSGDCLDLLLVLTDHKLGRF